MALVFLLYAFFASVFTIAKTALYYAEPFFLVGVRMALAGLIMLCIHWYRSAAFLPKTGRFWRRVLRLSFFNIYLTNILELWGLKYLTSFKTCFIYSLSPFVSALFSYILFSEKMTWKKWIGLIIGFMGLIPILIAQTTEEERTGHIWIFSWAELAVVCAAITSVYGWILLKQLVSEEKSSLFLVNGISMLVGGVLALVHSAITEQWTPMPITNGISFIECTLLLIVVSNFVCYNLYGFLLKRFSATFISFAGFTTPFFTALFGWLFLGEKTPFSFYLASLIVFFGLLLFYQEELRQIYGNPTKKHATSSNNPLLKQDRS